MENDQHFSQIGSSYSGGSEWVFGLEHADRRHHLYVIGQTGTGKTTLLRNLIIQDIEAGHGVGIIDPHGDLAHDLLDYIPRRRIEDVAFLRTTTTYLHVRQERLAQISSALDLIDFSSARPSV